jgi:hypothetical protein
VVYIPHPVQLLTGTELAARADAAFPAVIAALTSARPGTSAGRSE